MTVLQLWVEQLTHMQQSVLLAAIRGPDGIKKDHVVKQILRWYRRCILFCAFEKIVHKTPNEPCGGSFTGAIQWRMDEGMELVKEYLRHVDELPHHFQLHLMHAAEILGYKHPDSVLSEWWFNFYLAIVNDAHLCPESREAMERRLGDSEKQWREAEVVTAKKG